MNSKEKILVAKMLEMADDEFCNHGCNDLPDDFWEGWSEEERRAFVKEYHEWNGDPEEFDPDHLELPDFAVMAFLAARIREGAGL